MRRPRDGLEAKRGERFCRDVLGVLVARQGKLNPESSWIRTIRTIPHDRRNVHRTFEIIVPPSYKDTLTEELEQLEHVITVSVVRGASIKPPGEVMTVHALNRGPIRS